MSENKPVAGKPFDFTINVSLSDVVCSGGMDGFNDLVDNKFWDEYGDDFLLGSFTYYPERVVDGHLEIHVHAEEVEAYDDEED